MELNRADGSAIGALTGTSAEGLEFNPVASMARRLSDGRPNVTGTLAKHPSVRASEATRDRDNPPLNERGASVQATFDPINDPSYTECAAHGLVRQATTVHVVRITQQADSWELRWKKYFVAGYDFTELDCRLPFLAI